MSYIHQAVWSADQRAFALVDDATGSAHTQFRLIVWRAGERVRTYLTLLPLPHLDAIGYLAWSADDKRLLLLASDSQASVSVGFYELWCLNVDRGRAVKLAAPLGWAVTQAHWIGQRPIRYWTIHFVERHGRVAWEV